MIRFRSRFVFAILLTVLAFFSHEQRSAAQGVTGSISGVVTDASGASVAQGLIRAINEDTGAITTTKTDDTGGYVFPVLPAGAYRVESEVTGFKRSTTLTVRLA